MQNKKKVAAFSLVVLSVAISAPAAVKKTARSRQGGAETARIETILWQDPIDIASRDLYYGLGGKRHQPRGKFTFVKEDLSGSNPKFSVKDADGVKWKVKLGAETRPETAASRIVWALGYNTDEDYFLADLPVEELPTKLHRGDKLRDANGVFHNARLKRDNSDDKKIGIWEWDENPFVGSQELNAFRVLMSVMNNWDLKDVNNAVYEVAGNRTGITRHLYVVTDLGASFGAAGIEHYQEVSKGNLDSYRNSVFIRRVRRDSVDFESPRRPAAVALVNPAAFLSRLELRWIGRAIPREDARWAGRLLSRLSHKQICDAFRAANYSDSEAEGFSSAMEERIAELNRL